jgi:hypothetical protein
MEAIVDEMALITLQHLSLGCSHSRRGTLWEPRSEGNRAGEGKPIV